MLVSPFAAAEESATPGEQRVAEEDTEIHILPVEGDPRSSVHPAGTILSDWSPYRKRWFASARADVGFLFIRPRASVGFGVPHHHWWGADLVPIFSQQEGGGYAGLRFRHPRLEVRSGLLNIYAFERGFFDPASSYNELDLEREGHPTASYWALDSELTLSAPLGPVFFFAETQAVRTLDLSPDQWVWMQTMGVIVAPPWSFREQFRFSLRMPGFPKLFIGPAVETVWVPQRTEDQWTVRAGGFAQLWLYQDMQITTEILPTVYSPDQFGRMGSTWLRINARFLWATD